MTNHHADHCPTAKEGDTLHADLAVADCPVCTPKQRVRCPGCGTSAATPHEVGGEDCLYMVAERNAKYED